MTTSRPFSPEIIAGPDTWRMSATCPSGTWAPLGAVTSTLPSAGALARYWGAYRTRTGKRWRPSMVTVRFVSPTAVSITSWTAPTVIP